MRPKFLDFGVGVRHSAWKDCIASFAADVEGNWNLKRGLSECGGVMGGVACADWMVGF